LQKEITSLDVASLYTPKGCLVKLFAPGKRQYASLRKNYTEMSYLVDRLTNQIDLAGLALQKEMSLLDSLYESNLACYRALESRILAGEQALAIKEENTTSANNNSGSFVSLFQDRLFQLKQSKTVSMQLALQIRLTQYNQQVVIDKLKQLTDFALPLWQNQLALALNINHQQEALSAYRNAAKQAAEAMNKAKQTLKESSTDVQQEGKQVLTELERLKEADQQLQQLLKETIDSARKAKNPRDSYTSEA
jgi:uncharacterized protein YaaN involved in tellurite resistance